MGPIRTVEMHTGGEPLRIITDGISFPPNLSLLEKRRYLREEADHFRRFLMFEPRGHRDMYGALLVEPDTSDADFGVIFLHNEGYSTMCGHAVIALGRYAVDNNLVPVQEGETIVKIQCPCGLVEAATQVTDGKSGAVSFESVASFALRIDQFVNTAAYGPVELDIGYGGAFYGILDAASIGLNVKSTPVQDLITAAKHLSDAINKEIEINHPEEEDLGYLYGIIFTDGESGKDHDPSANVCIFADGQVDRSPTGSGVTARLAVMAAKGETEPGIPHQIESITGAVFSGEVRNETIVGPHKAVTVLVGGRAHYSGTAEFTVEEDDMLAGGFLLK